MVFIPSTFSTDEHTVMIQIIRWWQRSHYDNNEKDANDYRGKIIVFTLLEKFWQSSIVEVKVSSNRKMVDYLFIKS